MFIELRIDAFVISALPDVAPVVVHTLEIQTMPFAASSIFRLDPSLQLAYSYVANAASPNLMPAVDHLNPVPKELDECLVA